MDLEEMYNKSDAALSLLSLHDRVRITLSSGCMDVLTPIWYIWQRLSLQGNGGFPPDSLNALVHAALLDVSRFFKHQHSIHADGLS